MVNANTPAGNLKEVQPLQPKTSGSLRMNEITRKYERNLIKIKEICESANTDCNFFIQLSADAFDQMIAACNYAETSSACANAQTWVEIVMEATLDACSYNQASLNKTLPSLTEFNLKLKNKFNSRLEGSSE